MKLTAVVLTLNEERHLARCLSSLRDVVDHVVVADCFSTDRTLDIAREFRATVVQKRWINHATQFNWALTQLDDETEWVMRMDADEYLTPELLEEIRRRLPQLASDVDGVYLGRRIAFQGRLIRYGGLFPVRVLRIFRYGRGQCENRWMDEHIKVPGPTVEFQGELVDSNLNTLSWWIEKHNNYASREAVDLLNLEYKFMPMDSIARLSSGSQASIKRWTKERVYARLPGGFRALAYFVYRYVIRLGFLDGKEGTAFHFFQGFWYRYLVDAKVGEVKRYMRDSGEEIVTAIDHILGIKVIQEKQAGRQDI